MPTAARSRTRTRNPRVTGGWCRRTNPAGPTTDRRASIRRPACSSSARIDAYGIYFFKPEHGDYGWAGADYAVYGKGMLRAIDYQTGQVKWSHDLYGGGGGAGVLTTRLACRLPAIPRTARWRCARATAHAVARRHRPHRQLADHLRARRPAVPAVRRRPCSTRSRCRSKAAQCFLSRSSASFLNSRSSAPIPDRSARRSPCCSSARASALAIDVEQRLGEEVVRRGAVRVVGQRLAQVLFRFLLAAAEQPRHLEVPAAERAVGRSLLKRRIELQHLLERVLDRRRDTSAPAACRTTRRARPCSRPSRSSPSGAFGLERARPVRPASTPRSSAGAAPGLGVVAAEPVVGARQLPRRLEIARVGREPRAPRWRPPAARLASVGALAVERVGIARLRGACATQRDREAKKRDVEYADAGSHPAAAHRSSAKTRTAKGWSGHPQRVEKALEFLTSGYDADIDRGPQRRAVHRRL